MKKFLLSMMALVALFATSCEKEPGTGNNGGNNEPAALFDIKIEVDGNVADITVWPANYDMYYAWDVFSKADFEGEFAGDGLAAAEYYVEYMEYTASLYGYTLQDFLYQGKDNYAYDLESNTEYVCFAAGVDPTTAKVNTEVTLKEFATGAAKPVVMNVTECYVDYYPATADLPLAQVYFEMYDGDQIAIVAVMVDPAAANCAGTYTVATEVAAGYFFPGEISGTSVYPSFWGEVNAEGLLSAYGLLTGGTFKVAVNGANYTIDADMTDDNGKTYSFDYSGEVSYTDHSTDPSKAAKTNFRQLSIAARLHSANKAIVRR